MSETSLQRLHKFIDASPTPAHCAQTAAAWLHAVGFQELDPRSAPTPLQPGRGYTVTQGGAMLAFRVGAKSPTEAGFVMQAAHTDSPNLRVKPQPYVRAHGYIRLGVEVYGGAILGTWTDRDLGLAGQVVLRDGAGQRTALVDLRRPLCRVPNLAIHLNRAVNTDGLKLNEQTHLPALFAMDTQDEAPLHTLLATELGVAASDILAWDLSLVDLAAPVVSGARGEFFHAPRLDNQASCHAGLEALMATLDRDLPDHTCVLALFDHEEVGSQSERGAGGRALEHLLQRIVRDHEQPSVGGLERALAHSALVSTDMTHAQHPAWPEKSEPQHQPVLNGGPAIKQNANQRYGTTSETAARFLRAAERASVPVQWFVNRTDLACGSTVGPILGAGLGVATVDVGNPMLSMHSIRELCGTADHERMIATLTEWFAPSA